ncbi:MAG: dynamin family protein [Nakamurella sp.]
MAEPTAPEASPQPALIEAIAGLLDAAHTAAVDPRSAATLAEARLRLTGPLRVAIAGKVKAGKSTLLNALVGEELAPTDAGECTSIVTWYSEGDAPAVTVRPHGGTDEPTTFLRADGALDVDLGGRDAADIEQIDVRWPTSRLHDLTLIDTPGMESISVDISARTLGLLTPDTDRPPMVDAVLYLLRHAHASDARFLEAFHDDALVNGTPMNTVGVLSRADEIGSCRVDALEVAERVARRYHNEPRLRRLCPVIVPVAGLLGHAGVTLRESDFHLLQRLAGGTAEEIGELLLTADRFAARTSPIDITPAQRELLLNRLGLFGVRLSVELIRTGAVTDSSELAAELTRRSGLDGLRHVLLRQFSERSKVLKARSALLALDSVLRAGGCADQEHLQARAEQIRAGAHAFEEVRLLDRMRSEGFSFSPDRTAELERLLGGTGHDAASRLGLPADSADATVQAATDEALQRWQAIAAHPLNGRGDRLAARGVCRSLEGILSDLTVAAPR